MRYGTCWGSALCCTALLYGCGGGGDNTPPSEPPWRRGALLQSPPQRSASLTAAALQQRIGGNTTRGLALLVMTGDPVCGVDVHHLQYTTVGGLDERTTASGALMLPTGNDSRCNGERPMVLYAHGTNPAKSYNLANLSDTSNAANGESLMLAAFYAAKGYIVVAPNYAGYDTSTLPYHPFLVADQQSKDMIDGWTAATTALPTVSSNVRASDKLFLTGYSQGGYVAMATHRAMQQLGTKVTASAPMSGPYALAAQTDAPFYGRVPFGSTLFGTLLASSYQKVYGNIYATPGDFYEPAYAPGIESLLPGPDAASLLASGKLPEYALFSSTPPVTTPGSALHALLATSTPARTGSALDRVYAQGFGTPHLVSNAARLAYVSDALNHPDGVVPVLGNRLPAATPQHPLRVATRRNDLRDWTPLAPVLLCGGEGDATVPFAVNSQVMGALWSGLPGGVVTVLDVDASPGGASDPYRAEKLGFALVKTAVMADAVLAGKDPSLEVARNYHAGLLPFCNSAARTFFDRF